MCKRQRLYVLDTAIYMHVMCVCWRCRCGRDTSDDCINGTFEQKKKNEPKIKTGETITSSIRNACIETRLKRISINNSRLEHQIKVNLINSCFSSFVFLRRIFFSLFLCFAGIFLFDLCKFLPCCSICIHSLFCYTLHMCLKHFVWNDMAYNIQQYICVCT